MQLREWIFKERMSNKAFAKLMDVSYVTVYGIVNGRQEPNIKNAKKIINLTNGEVSWEDLYGPREPQKRFLRADHLK